MFRDNPSTRAETASRGEAFSNRPNNDIDGRRRDIVQLGESAASTSNSTDGEGLVKDEAELVLFLEFDLDNTQDLQDLQHHSCNYNSQSLGGPTKHRHFQIYLP